MKPHVSKCHEKNHKHLSENTTNHKVLFCTYPKNIIYTLNLFFFLFSMATDGTADVDSISGHHLCFWFQGSGSHH